MISHQDRREAVELINEATAAGARVEVACKHLGIAFSSYLKWKQAPEDRDKRLPVSMRVTPARSAARNAKLWLRGSAVRMFVT